MLDELNQVKEVISKGPELHAEGVGVACVVDAFVVVVGRGLAPKTAGRVPPKRTSVVIENFIVCEISGDD